ncbi:MAG: phosphodiester glycosidase family protein [Ruminococcaceae bacterium]|nr:phosphodiester glycosidase family protein [Oscillospiraceae bacterium]
MKRSKLFTILFCVVLICFTAYVLLDTFLIERAYSSVTPEESEDSENNDLEQVYADRGITEPFPIQTDTMYIDDNISVVVTEYREHRTTVYVADIRLKSVEYLKSAFAEDTFGRNITEKVADIAKRKDAIIAVNGDFYGAQPRGYVLRNGELYRDLSRRDTETLIVFEDGSFDIIVERKVDIEDVMAEGAIHSFAFGPALVVDGEIMVTRDQEVGISMESNPRTAIGIIDNLHYLLIVSDGRTKESRGLSLYELAEFMRDHGCKIAYNLDGGGSATMYFNGDVVNFPTTNGIDYEERSVSDIVYIGY